MNNPDTNQSEGSLESVNETVQMCRDMAISLFQVVGDCEVYGDKNKILVTLRNDLPKRFRLKLESIIKTMQSALPRSISYIKSVDDFEALVHRKVTFK